MLTPDKPLLPEEEPFKPEAEAFKKKEQQNNQIDENRTNWTNELYIHQMALQHSVDKTLI